jgi:hypothetical protein
MFGEGIPRPALYYVIFWNNTLYYILYYYYYRERARKIRLFFLSPYAI